MQHKIILARPDHAPELAKLLIEASSGVIEAVYGGTVPGKQTWEIIEPRYRTPGTTNSYENCWVVEEGTTVLGGLHCFAIDDLLKDPPSNRIPEDRTWILEPIEKLDASAAGTYHINFVTVWETHQGQGIGKALMEKAMQEARKRGFAELSLIVFEQNRRALGLYEKLGFAEIARHPAPRHPAIRQGDVLMMVAAVQALNKQARKIG